MPFAINAADGIIDSLQTFRSQTHTPTSGNTFDITECADSLVGCLSICKYLGYLWQRWAVVARMYCGCKT